MRSAACPSQPGGMRWSRGSRSNAGTSAMRSGVEAEQRVRAELDRDRTLGVVSKREARHAQVRRLLLNAARVGQHGGRAGDEAEELDVAGRRQKRHAGHIDAEPVERVPGARVHREDHRELARERTQGTHGVSEQRPVDQRRPVHRHHHVPAELDAVPGGRAECLDPAAHRDQGVDHRVADVVDPLRRMALVEQVRPRLRRVNEQEIRDRVGDDPVELLRHRPVEAAQPRLDVPDGHLQLRRRDCRRQGRVHITRHQHHIGPHLQEHRARAARSRAPSARRATRSRPAAGDRAPRGRTPPGTRRRARRS